MHRNMIHLQRGVALTRRLAQIDAEVALRHAHGDRTDVDELLDERLDLVHRLAILDLQRLG